MLTKFDKDILRVELMCRALDLIPAPEKKN